MKCANCNSEAMYVYQITLTNSVYYCGKDLPKFLEPRKKAGLLKITDQFTVEHESALDALKTEVIEETAIETPAPKKKASSKKAK
jgi:hypothetical protein